MRQFYYFSNNRLKFVEIRNFYGKFIFLIFFFSLITSFFTFSGYFVYKEIVNPDAAVEELEGENKLLTEKLTLLLDKYQNINDDLDKFSEYDNELRIALNLSPVTEDDRLIGIGGSVFENFMPSSTEDVNKLIFRLDNYVEQVDQKLEFEKNNFKALKAQFEFNQKLFAVLPAIKPAVGRFGDKFGLRYHPILKRKRMHNGVDIVCDRGTKVVATGSGKITFVGWKPEAGKTIEIDHGFGYRTNYFHLSKFFVKKGQKIERGEKIALSGNTGLSKGPHLHYEVRHNGIPLEPRNFIYEDLDLFKVANK